MSITRFIHLKVKESENSDFDMKKLIELLRKNIRINISLS